ncbi:MAG TPA: isoprenylcysteine carboxylmethyltransferase family protein [Anaerolineales bacterium]|nr:isoprenylcysteine carboxylmethyltransferase family protein [Anaerolineales bacterium]
MWRSSIAWGLITSNMDNMMETFLNYFLIVYYTLFFTFAMLLPTYRVWKTTGVNPYKLGTSDSAHDYIGRLFRITLIACALLIAAFVFFPSVYEKFFPVSFLSQGGISGAGLILLLFALAWVLIAQQHMQKSWRIGIDEDVRTELVQRGLFKISRNPIFLGMRLMLLGLFLILPNVVMLIIGIVGEILIQIQVRLEEEYLTRIYRDSYLTYQKLVRRWF